MRPVQPPRLKLRSARKWRRALWVIKDREREISTGFGKSGSTLGYASFRRTVSRAGIICQGWVNAMQLAGLDGPLTELIPACTDPTRPDASQDRRFRHAHGSCRLPEGVTHALRSVP